MKTTRLLTLATAGVLLTSTATFADDKTVGERTEQTADKVGDKIDRAADKTGDALNRAADKTGDAVGNAVDRARNRVGEVDARDAGPAGAGGLPPGVGASNKDDSEDIRDTLGEVTEAALTKDGLNDLVERFVDADRNRFEQFFKDHKNFDQLNNLSNQIRTDFKNKYGKDFDVDHKIVFGQGFKGMTLVQGEIVNPALLSNWPVPQKSDAKDQKPADGAAANTPAIRRDLDRNLDKGRNVAVVTIPASHGAPELTLSMIHELPDNWKIDVPDHLDGQKLHDQVMSHLRHVSQMKDQWPADINEAQRMVAHHVLMGVYDIPMKAPAAGAAADKQ